MSTEAVLRPDKDHSKEVDKQLPEAEELAKVAFSSSNYDNNVLISFQTNLQGAIEKLIALEKQTRQVSRLVFHSMTTS